MQSLSNGKIGDDDLQIAESGNGATRGRDLRMLAAAFLYNITGDRRYEDAMAQESVATSPKWYANKGYPTWDQWPHGEALWPAPYCYANNEFTPQQTMLGKMALLGYLYSRGETRTPSGK